MSSYLITGSTRGIGFGLAQLLASKPASEVSHIITTSRKSSEAVVKLVEANPDRVHFVELDVSNPESVAAAVKQVERILAEHKTTLDVLINNAAIMNYTAGPVETMSDLAETFNVNVIGTHLVITGFLPLLRNGNGKKIVIVGSMLGSLTLSADFALIPAPAYKISKSATNMMTRQYAHDLDKEGFTVFTFSPGWVKTDMGSENAELTIGQSTTAIYNILSSANRDSNGKFFNVHIPGWKSISANHYDGGEFAW
ncbi:hypothetical protein DL96DRAFT_1572212 [Flagelloscypha sp. PMI_526]|nr:hypothetical protein DL96DRAFT_1572212 [Flagelloscypha sp. PMI_526]